MDDILQRFNSEANDQIFDHIFQNEEKYKLTNIKVIKIYYCFYGRNAWHSTWSTKYSNNCMHSSLSSAKKFAERNRVQGSVFYIEELPAFCFYGGKFPIVVTQINESCPFREYSAIALKDDVSLGYKKIAGSQSNYLKLGSPLIGTILSFNSNSRFWKTPPPVNNSIIFLYSSNDTEQVPLKTTKLRTWKSTSQGKDYYLSWGQVDRRVRQSSTMRLYNQYKSNKAV